MPGPADPTAAHTDLALHRDGDRTRVVLLVRLNAGEEVCEAFRLVRDRQHLQHRAAREPDRDMILPRPHIHTDTQFDGWCCGHVTPLL